MFLGVLLSQLVTCKASVQNYRFLFFCEFLFETDARITRISPCHFYPCFDTFFCVLRVTAFFKVYFSAKPGTTSRSDISTTNWSGCFVARIGR